MINPDMNVVGGRRSALGVPDDLANQQVASMPLLVMETELSTGRL